jgi:hypothetical protein
VKSNNNINDDIIEEKEQFVSTALITDIINEMDKEEIIQLSDSDKEDYGFEKLRQQVIDD